MNLKNISLVLAFLGLATAAFADDESSMKLTISVTGDTGDSDVHIELDSDDLGFNLHDMQEGENRSIIDKSGKSILVTREADGFRLEVDGKTINMPLLHGKQHTAFWMGDSELDDVDLHVRHRANMTASHAMDGVMIVSGKPVDDATQQAIRSLLESAGHGSEVRFVDGKGSPGGVHGIRVIEKKVEVTE